MTAAGCLGFLVGLLSLPAALAQSNEEIASAVKIDAKVIPYRLFWLFPSSLYDVEVNLSIGERASPFSALLLQCDFFGDDPKKGLMTRGWVSRSEFKRSADGRLVAQRRHERLPGGDVTNAECQVMDVRR